MQEIPFETNPLLQQEDYFKGYKENIDKMRNDYIARFLKVTD